MRINELNFVISRCEPLTEGFSTIVFMSNSVANRNCHNKNIMALSLSLSNLKLTPTTTIIIVSSQGTGQEQEQRSNNCRCGRQLNSAPLPPRIVGLPQQWSAATERGGAAE